MKGLVLQITGLGCIWWHKVTVGSDAVQGKGTISFPLLGRNHEFEKSPFNFLKTPQQLEAAHQLGWFSPYTLDQT